jgi:hypothetical protein
LRRKEDGTWTVQPAGTWEILGEGEGEKEGAEEEVEGLGEEGMHLGAVELAAAERVMAQGGA